MHATRRHALALHQTDSLDLSRKTTLYRLSGPGRRLSAKSDAWASLFAFQARDFALHRIPPTFTLANP
ncbi:hypothetical protein [Massilia sp. YIM B04103]|uniref:hypothetical protein n=1 Tax=Massilia sp. YIM B04103 TaxID=2963106 RepID=UPI00210AD230|nr:hypothetical protein [Massilia sp. YIM B04103]